MKSTDYKFWAGAGGRKATRKIQAYKRHIFILYCIIGVVMAAAIMLSTYICNLQTGGP